MKPYIPTIGDKVRIVECGGVGYHNGYIGVVSKSKCANKKHIHVKNTHGFCCALKVSPLTNKGWSNPSGTNGRFVSKTHKRWKPEIGEIYYIPELSMGYFYDSYSWDDGYTDGILYSRGLVFKTKREAIEAAKKMIQAIGGEM